MTICMFASTIIMIMFMNSSHPVALMSLILIQTLMLCVMTWIMCNISWFSYILFLIFLGGLMVLFIYITSLASNEKFNLSMKNYSTTMMISLTMMVIIMLNKENMITMEYFNLTKMMMYMYSTTMMIITMSTMIYLLLTLIVVVKMTSKYKGPMRSMVPTK